MTQLERPDRWLRPLVVAACLVLVAPPAEAQIADLQYRVSTLEAQIAALRANAAGGAGGPVLERLDRLEQEIRELTGRVEELAHQQRRIAEDAQRRFGDFEFRLTELEGGDVSALPPPAPLGATGDGGSGGGQGPAVSISERDELDQAIADIDAGRLDQGAQKVGRFLDTYGQSPLRAEALYWLGESQLRRSAYQDAARSFLQAYNQDLKAATAPRSLLRLGVTLGRIGQTEDACLTLQEVMIQYPDAPEALLDDVRSEAELLLCG